MDNGQVKWCIVAHGRWTGHQVMRMNSSSECYSTLPYQCNNRTVVTSSSSSTNDFRNHRYPSYADSNGFDADDVATLRPGNALHGTFNAPD